MTSELIVDVKQEEVSIALLEDKKLVEYQNEGMSDSFAVGNIYIAKVKKIMTGLNACFVNVGYERDAFLHYADLGTQFRTYQQFLKFIGSGKQGSVARTPRQPELDKDGSIQNVLKMGEEVLVQVVKEPISTKGPRLTGEISFAGRFLVLIPFSDKISVSSKIKNNGERARLKQLIHSIKPQGFGVIVRTVAEGKRVADLDNELKILHRRWTEAVERLAGSPLRPLAVHKESNRSVAMLRDIFNPSFENIYVNDAATFDEIKDYVSLIAPERKDIVKLYKGKLPILDNFNVTRQVKQSLGRIVTFKHGAYLIIEHTEALHVVDVNSGNRSRSEDGQESNALDVNLGAADELARQLRLRDMGGIIVVDFIDMDEPEHRQKLYERMCQNMQSDRARHNILPLSKFGLMQITRQRVRPVIDINVEEECPTCSGTGHIKSSLLFTDHLERKIDTLSVKLGIRKFKLHVHPFVAAYLSQGLPSLKTKWRARYGWGISIVPDQSLPYLGYRFLQPGGEEIDMKEKNEFI